MNSTDDMKEPELNDFRETTSSKFSNKIVLVTIGFALLVMGIIGGWYMGKTTQTAQIDQTTPSPIPSPETSDEMEGWKTYINETYKFSIQYGPDLRVSSNGDFSADLVDKTKSQKDIVPEDIKVRISVDQTKRNFDKIYVAENNSVIVEEQRALDAMFTKVRNRTIAGYKVIDYTYDVPGNETEKTFIMGTIINKNEVLIEISTWNLSIKDFNQILSTFEFVE